MESGNVIVLAHARASSDRLKAKTDGEASSPLAARASRISKNLSGAMPRVLQFTTADAPTAVKPAVAVGPPKASMTSSTVLSMLLDTSRNVKLSRPAEIHTLAIVTKRELGPNARMKQRSRAEVAKRLIATQKAFDLLPSEFCKKAGIPHNQWSQFTSPNSKRRITVEAAHKLIDTYHVDLDWIYDGKTERLPKWLAKKLESSMAA